MDELARARNEIRLTANALAESWEEINLLYSIGEILGRTVKLEDAAATILSEISDTVAADLGAIYVHDAARGLLVPIAAKGVAPMDLGAVPIDDTVAVSAQVFRDAAPRIFDAGVSQSPLEVPQLAQSTARTIAISFPLFCICFVLAFLP